MGIELGKIKDLVADGGPEPLRRGTRNHRRLEVSDRATEPICGRSGRRTEITDSMISYRGGQIGSLTIRYRRGQNESIS